MLHAADIPFSDAQYSQQTDERHGQWRIFGEPGLGSDHDHQRPDHHLVGDWVVDLSPAGAVPATLVLLGDQPVKPIGRCGHHEDGQRQPVMSGQVERDHDHAEHDP